MPEHSAPKRTKKGGNTGKEKTGGGHTDLLKKEKIGKTHHNKRFN
jgi:hypothetical protein